MDDTTKNGEIRVPRPRHYALTLMRLTVGFIMATHGWLKLTDLQGTVESFAGMGIPMPHLSAYLAVAGELLGGLGLLVGLLTPIAAAGVLVTMAVAIGYVHLSNGLMAKDGGFEYPLTLAAVALFFLVRGAGPISVDAWLERRRQKPDEVDATPRQASSYGA